MNYRLTKSNNNNYTFKVKILPVFSCGAFTLTEKFIHSSTWTPDILSAHITPPPLAVRSAWGLIFPVRSRKKKKKKLISSLL